MYPDELEISGSIVKLTVKPTTEYGVQSLLQFELEVTLLPKFKAVLTNPRGMDENEIINFSRFVKQTAKELRSSETGCWLFTLVSNTRAALTEYNDHMEHRCPI
jgi:hypothetical protein